MYKTPYDTLVCKHFSNQIDKIKVNLTEAIISGDLQYDSVNEIHYVTNRNKNIKPFSHPVTLTIPSRKDQLFIVVDTRGLTTLNEDTGIFRKTPDFEYQTVRATLMRKVWLSGNTTDLLNTGDLNLKLYSHLIAETLSRRLNLDTTTTDQIKIITAFHYICLHHENRDLNEDTLLKDAKRISRCVFAPIQEVMDIIQQLGSINDTNALCRALALQTQSVRLEKISPGIIFSMLGGIWFGANSNEQSAVALEHPPTFVAMVYMCVNNRSYRKTVLAQLAERLDKRKELTEVLVRNVNNILRG